MYLTLEGSRRSGKTTALVDTAKTYLETYPQAEIAVLAPMIAQKRYLQELFAKKVKPSDLVRVSFMTGVGRGTFAAYFVDESKYLPEYTMEFIHKAVDGGTARLYETVSVE